MTVDIDACIDAAQDGDMAALEALIVHCAKRIRSTVWRNGSFLKDQDLDDATQDALAKIATIIRQFGRRSAICTWMCGVAEMTTREFIRKYRRRVDALGVAEIEEHSDPHGGPELTAVRRDLVRFILGALEPAYRDVVALKYIEDLDDDEIAQRLFISPDTVRSRLTTVRKRVRMILKGGELDEP
jgi:RNA polymerase sigma-70 factor (ECF subfamily)